MIETIGPDVVCEVVNAMVRRFSEPERFVELSELSEKIGITKRTIYKYNSDGMPHYGKMYLVSECVAWIRSNIK